MRKLTIYTAIAAMLLLPAGVVLYEAGWYFMPTVQGTQLLGLWALVLLLFQFILTARVRLLDRWIGLDQLIHLHRLIGMGVLVTAVLHGALYSIPAAFEGRLTPDMPGDWPIALGSTALLLLLAIGITAMLYRKLGWRYETWKRIHQGAYLLLPLVLLHGFVFGSHLSWHPVLQLQILAGTAVVVWLLLTRGIRFIRRTPMTLRRAEQVTHDTTRLVFDRPQGFRFVPGQFVFLRIRGRTLSEPPHPFTLSGNADADHLEITAKAIGDFTARLPGLQPGDQVSIDGPFGVFHPLPQQDKVLWIAGGIGITPFLAALRSLETRDHPEIVLIWGNKTPADIPYQQELRTLLETDPGIRLMHVFSENSEPEPDFGEVYHGFVTAALLKDAADEDLPRTSICGPPAMRRAVLPLLRDIGIRSIAYERFDL
ncbi:ferredoxin reductase family protein [Spirochaeta africana]|uniref:Putative ferric reductase n=1 Tax=Spirochaeta africana (strain ATCC 700263 / DSM 8902 / Z-7692) TaxID=889378 RepID=H9ULV8_SPIAZ|nr:ferredoxin reductase family protein [Spirochaeta africana]AFG38501.1 putative ferric reductase [Spirochaeta africana DSM 8902]